MSSPNDSPALMNNESDRRKMLAGAFDEEQSDNASESFATPPNKNKTPNKSMLNKFKSGRSASSNGNNDQSQMRSMSGGSGAVGSTTLGPSKSNNTGGITIEGSNIGSSASEPDWTIEQQQQIANLCNMRLKHVMMSETRRSIVDPNEKYLTNGKDGSTITRSAAILPNPSWNEFSLGLGKVKPDEKTGKGKMYSDVVMKGPNWLLSQWTSKDVIMEGVPENILDKPPRMVNGRPERRIGHDFARIGLPKTSFGPIFETMKSIFPTILDDVSITKGYYWLNASWGVTGSPGTFVYPGANRIKQNTFKLYEAMKMIMSSSSMGAAAIAISVSNESKMQNGKMVSANNRFDLSIKLHNMFHMKKVSYHSPPQAASTGFEVADDLYNDAEILEPMSNMGVMMSDTADAFNNNAPNPFMNAIGAIGANSNSGGANDGLV